MSLMETVKATFLPPSEARPRKRPDDVLDLFHGHAAKRFTELRRKAHDFRVLADVPAQELQGLMRRRTEVKNRRLGETGRPLEKETLAALDIELIGLEADIAEVERTKAERDQNASSVYSVVRACENYALDFLLTTAVSLHAIKPAALKKGENEVDALYRVRDEITDINADISEVKSTPLPSAEAKQKVRDHIAGMIEAGRIDVSGTLRRSGGGVQWPTSYSNPNQIETQSVLAFICSDQIIAKLEKEVDLLADDERALTHEQCETKLKALHAKRLELERDEEELLRAAAAKGFAVTRRPDADVRAVLGLGSSMPTLR